MTSVRVEEVEEITDPTVRECEAALKKLGRDVKITKGECQYSKLEFPSINIQRTKAEPCLDWSMNRLTNYSCLYKNRSEFSNTNEILENLSKTKPDLHQNRF